MSDQGASEAYLRMLEGIAGRDDQIGSRTIASQWPFVGSDYRRLLVVGQALAGWDDKTSPALWTPGGIQSEAGRQATLAATRGWSSARAEPMEEPLATRSRSPFWTLSKRTCSALEPAGETPWYARYAWSNLFPLAWGDTNRSPWVGDGLWEAQYEHVPAYFWETADSLDPTRILILAGKGFWDQTAGALGLAGLARLDWPLIAGGQVDRRSILWTYHPGAHLSGITRQGFSERIVSAFDELRRP